MGARYKKNTLTCAVAVSLGILTGQAHAQLMLEEVVVTAQKRTESLQDLPVSVSVFFL